MDDGPLIPTRQRFGDAVHALVDPLPQWARGSCRWSPSVYVRLRGALGGGASVTSRRACEFRAPVRVAVLDLVVTIDATVGGWWPSGKGTIGRLHELVDRSWRPMDCEALDSMSDEIVQWLVTAAGLLGDAPVKVFLRDRACPRCESSTAYRHNGSGESVRGPALRVSEDGCVCSACGAFWPPDRFHFLAELLGCEPMPT